MRCQRMITLYRKSYGLSVRSTRSSRHALSPGSQMSFISARRMILFYDPYWYTPKYVYSTYKKALKAAVQQLEDDIVDQRRRAAREKVVLHDMECILEMYKMNWKQNRKENEMEPHEFNLRYQGIELGQKVYVANHLKSRVERAIVSGVDLRLCADGIIRAEYYTLISREDGEHLHTVYPSEIFISELPALERLVVILNNEIKDRQEEEDEVREALVRAKMRMEELQRQQCREGKSNA